MKSQDYQLPKNIHVSARGTWQMAKGRLLRERHPSTPVESGKGNQTRVAISLASLDTLARYSHPGEWVIMGVRLDSHMSVPFRPPMADQQWPAKS